jgi:hypothetical protein
MILTREQQMSKPTSDDRLANSEAFSRLDESDDSLFYATDRFVQHLDSVALATVEELIVDDVTVRIRNDNPVVVNVRSKSRVGKGDLGKNAKNISLFLDTLKGRLTRGSRL